MLVSHLGKKMYSVEKIRLYGIGFFWLNGIVHFGKMGYNLVIRDRIICQNGIVHFAKMGYPTAGLK